MTCVLIAAAIPCGLAGLIQNYAGLLLIRFFVGIAGASFVPCLTWCTLFYDKVCDGAISHPSEPVLKAIDRLLSGCRRYRQWFRCRYVDSTYLL